jgi:hypothetical protein
VRGWAVVHQLFTSEGANPGAMARIGPQREWFSAAKGERLLSVR